jgi:hypothetical protein
MDVTDADGIEPERETVRDSLIDKVQSEASLQAAFTEMAANQRGGSGPCPVERFDEG